MNDSTQGGRKISAFEYWLRTGRRASPVQYKFNGWHDPDDGKFTEVGSGRYFPRGTRAPEKDRLPIRPRSQFSIHDPHNPKNYSIVRVKPGDNLTHIAKLRRGLTAADIAWLNEIDLNAPLAVGREIKLPHQQYLDDGRDAKNRFLALAYYMDRHEGRLPPDPSHPPPLDEQLASERAQTVANGYRFTRDLLPRTHVAEGELILNPAQTRSQSAQSSAGGRDRRDSDEGGHFIARMFNGPKDPFNHFAQDKTFNRSGYRRIENLLRQAKLDGKRVFVRIEARYDKLSERPFEIRFRYSIDGASEEKVFPNGSRFQNEK